MDNLGTNAIKLPKDEQHESKHKYLRNLTLTHDNVSPADTIS